jgi:hypothetical protein
MPGSPHTGRLNRWVLDIRPSFALAHNPGNKPKPARILFQNANGQIMLFTQLKPVLTGLIQDFLFHQIAEQKNQLFLPPSIKLEFGDQIRLRDRLLTAMDIGEHIPLQ